MHLNKLVKLLSATLLGASLAFSATAANEREAAIAERIAPAGEVCMSGEPCAAAPAQQAAAGPQSGGDIYNARCAACHGSGLMGAPKVGNAGDWAARIGQGTETLYKHAINGFNAMPPKGGCTTCSEDEIKSAVDHMVESSK